jgi:glycosyltransferase involved in cell wall biosynthesis
VTLIPNGVDVEHFRRPRARPKDLPRSPVAVYVGSLHDSRVDVELVVDVARALPTVNLVFVGPNSLSAASQAALEGLSNVFLVGPRRYDDVPAYLQHADVVIVPHRISPFTESLDPIKAYECLAVGTPTVATRVAGFRDHDGQLHIVDREAFAARVATLLSAKAPVTRPNDPPSWEERALEFERALGRASSARGRPPGADAIGNRRTHVERLAPTIRD